MKSFTLVAFALLFFFPAFSQDEDTIIIHSYYFNHERIGVLDPGLELVKRGVIITNLSFNGNVSFKLSKDGVAWEKYALGPRFSRIFHPIGEAGYAFKMSSYNQNGEVVEKSYKLAKGNCYSVFFDRGSSCWDLTKNDCRRLFRN